MSMVLLRYEGETPYTVLNVQFHPQKEREVTPEAAWQILNQSARGKEFKIISGQPIRGSSVPARFVGKTALDEALRVPDNPAISDLPAAIPGNLQEALIARNWKTRLPGVVAQHHAGALAQWCALSGLKEQAEEILRLVTVHV